MIGVLAKAGEEFGIKVVKDEASSDSFFARSDNQAFADAGIPAHTLSVGYVFPGLPPGRRRVAEDRLREHGESGSRGRASGVSHRGQRRAAEVERRESEDGAISKIRAAAVIFPRSRTVHCFGALQLSDPLFPVV